MRQFFTLIVKDIRLLWRDRTALMLLFCMPAALALIITLVQQNIFEISHGGGTIHGILLNQDNSDLANSVEKELNAWPGIDLVRWQDSEKDALKLLETGVYQFCIVIPADTWLAIESSAKQAVTEGWGLYSQNQGDILRRNSEIDPLPLNPKLKVYVDSTLGGGFKMALQNAVNQFALGLETRLKLMFFAQTLKLHMAASKDVKDNFFLSRIESLPTIVTAAPDLIRVEMTMAGSAGFTVLPTATQQTFPAMAVFGIFFIVVPLSGALIRERHSGIFMRLSVAPVSVASISAARLVAYSVVCLCQFGLIVLVGKTLLPWLGGVPLAIGPKLIPVLIIVVCIALAACGSGLLLGVLGRTTDQVSAIGPIAVVIAAAVGGIMVPVFVMPPVMQIISRFSPLEWGHRALLDVMVRGAGLNIVWPRMALLLLFFVITLLISRICYRQN
jgi:ABC-2 type transport system permease protein